MPPPAADDDEPAPPWLVPRSAYVHIPFCASKCGYCDFASVAGRDGQMAEYLDALAAEFALVLRQPRPVDTIFVGGGTPTYLPAPLLDRVLTFVNDWLPLRPGGEFTVESNPNTLDADKVAVLAAHGVNRVSLGAQSFQPATLKALDRDHDPAAVGRAFDLLRPAIENVSLDLIFGAPGQTRAGWAADLECALALAPSHVSAYGLTYEKGTPLWRQKRLGVVQAVEENDERAMMEHALDRLAAAGFRHYEVSNYAGPGGPCRHNLAYWANHAYWGLGTGAAAYVEGERTLNGRDLGGYLDRCRRGVRPTTQSETLLPEERARETAMLHLRRTAGLMRAEFRAQTGFAVDDLAPAALRRWTEHELLADDGAGVRLTRAGLMVADGVLASFL